jgi:hypothetical protein
MSKQKCLALIFIVALTACGGSSGTGIPATLSGNWQMTLQNATSSETQSGFLLETANTLSGSFLLSGQTNSGQTSCSGVGSAVGQASGNNVQLTVSPAGQTVNLTGMSANNATSMSGNYSILAAGCGQTDLGTWSATLVDTLTGNFQATFSLSGSGTVFHFSGNITQGPNTGQSTATLSGTMTSSDSPCFTSATIGGVVSGTSVVWNWVSSDGSELGKYSGTMTTDATSIAGTYRFSNASDPTVLGACQGYGGDATVAVQPSSTTSSMTN